MCVNVWHVELWLFGILESCYINATLQNKCVWIFWSQAGQSNTHLSTESIHDASNHHWTQIHSYSWLISFCSWWELKWVIFCCFAVQFSLLVFFKLSSAQTHTFKWYFYHSACVLSSYKRATSHLKLPFKSKCSEDTVAIFKTVLQIISLLVKKKKNSQDWETKPFKFIVPVNVLY